MAERRDHPHRAGVYDWITFLVTGPEANLMAWQLDSVFVVELFDRRGQTVRCRAHGLGRGQEAYDEAVDLARRHDVTVQDMVDTGRTMSAETHDVGGGAAVTIADCVEEYPVVHLGTHGMKWPPGSPCKASSDTQRLHDH